MSTSARGAVTHGGSRTPAGAEDPVLLSKITPPAMPGWAVGRPRIDKLIADGARGPLTTVTGPPGAGKTMAIASWATARASTSTLIWISLDRYDNRPKVFWSYVCTALRQAGVALPRVLSAPTRGTAVNHVFLLRLASVLAVQDPPVVMVLDDLHLLKEPATVDGLAYVLRNAWPRLHLVVSSRMDPLLPLHRYRLAGELAEIRADDLAFSLPECSSLLAHHGITLSAAALECLAGRMEGWAAGMRMAALSLDGHPDPEQFVKELGAEDSAVTSYLVDEVLNAQPPSVRELLLRTSILDCVNEELACDLVDHQQVATALPALARANAFVRPLGQGWYRYHGLFSAVLRLKLRRESPGDLPGLHRRAAKWYQRNGMLAEAVRHTADAGDWPSAAGIVLDECAIGQLIEPRGNQALAEEFRRMPQDQGWSQPPPLLVMAAIAQSGPAANVGMAALTAAQSMLERLPADDEVPARLAAALITLARSRQAGDRDIAMSAAAQAETLLDELPDGLLRRHPAIRAKVLSGGGAAALLAGHIDEADDSFRAGVAAASAPDARYERADCLGYLALVAALRGQLSHALDLANEAVEATKSSADGLGEHVIPAASLALAAAYLERNDLRRAHGQLKLADAALRISPDKLMNAVACMITARRRLAEGRAAAASEMIGSAREGWSPPAWLEQRLSLLESRARAAAGDIPAAVAAAERAGSASTGSAAVALAHAWLAGGDHQAAARALTTMMAGTGAVQLQPGVEGSLVEARLGYETGDGARGRRSLERAFQLSKPEQLRLPLIMERGWIRQVLRRDPDLAHAYQHLLEPGPGSHSSALAPARQAVTTQAKPLIIEQLSEREREVLRHLSGMLSTAEIATEMYISVNTVKTHLRSIYRKLAAAHRGEAVRRARQLELI